MGVLADSIGRFTFSGVRIGWHLLAVKQYGYDEINVDVEVAEGQTPVRIELKPGPLPL